MDTGDTEQENGKGSCDAVKCLYRALISTVHLVQCTEYSALSTVHWVECTEYSALSACMRTAQCDAKNS